MSYMEFYILFDQAQFTVHYVSLLSHIIAFYAVELHFTEHVVAFAKIFLKKDKYFWAAVVLIYIVWQERPGRYCCIV